MSKYPFLDRIPINDRLTAIERLHDWQARHHPHVVLDVTVDIKRGKWPFQEAQITVNVSEDTRREIEAGELVEITKEMTENSDVKERIN